MREVFHATPRGRPERCKSGVEAGMDRRLSLVCDSGSGRNALGSFAIAAELLSDKRAFQPRRSPCAADAGAVMRSRFRALPRATRSVGRRAIARGSRHRRPHGAFVVRRHRGAPSETGYRDNAAALQLGRFLKLGETALQFYDLPVFGVDLGGKFLPQTSCGCRRQTRRRHRAALCEPCRARPAPRRYVHRRTAPSPAFSNG